MYGLSYDINFIARETGRYEEKIWYGHESDKTDIIPSLDCDNHFITFLCLYQDLNWAKEFKSSDFYHF